MRGFSLLALLLVCRCILSSETWCKQSKVSEFDAVCKFNENVYIVSANPCHTNTSIGLTVIAPTYSIVNHTNTTTSIMTPWVFTDYIPTLGVILETHMQPFPSKEERHKSRLHTRLYVVDMGDWKKNSSLSNAKNLIDVKFVMFPDACNFQDGFLGKNGHNPQSPGVCQVSMRTGQYSTLCYNDTYNSIQENGFYFVAFNPCTTPQSAVVVTYFENQKGLTVQKYTQNKMDTFVPVNAKDKANGCGIQLRMDQHDVRMHVTLQRGCKSDKKGVEILINDYYNEEVGMICPLSDCTELEGELSHSCRVPWILDGNSTLVAHINMTLDVCSKYVNVHARMNLEHSKKLAFHGYSFNETLVADHFDAMHDQKHAKSFRLTMTDSGKAIPDTKNDGYLGLDKGQVSLFVHENDDSMRILILRHYPYEESVIPLVYDEFWVDRCKKCPHICEEGSDSSLKVVLPIVIVLLLTVIVVVGVVIYRRRGRRMRGPGLPYEIHLESDDIDDMDGLDDDY